jgi:hypothetical protein
VRKAVYGYEQGYTPGCDQEGSQATHKVAVEKKVP